jgi:hypothetical protein
MTGRHSTITVAQRDEFWRRYKAGESVLGIIARSGSGAAISIVSLKLRAVLRLCRGRVPSGC